MAKITGRYICPTTGDYINPHSNRGVCQSCGNVAHVVAHYKIEVGRWIPLPGFFNRLLSRKKWEKIKNQ